MSTPNNRRRDPGALTGEVVLLWVGIVLVVLVVGSVYAAMHLGHQVAGTGVQVPTDPFTVLFGVLDGTLPWPAPAGWWVLGAVAAVLVVLAVLVGVAVHRLRKGRTRVDGTLHTVEEVTDLGHLADTTVYNLHTSGAHTFFLALADDEYLVHNSACNLALHGLTKGPKAGVYRIVMKDGAEYIGRSKNIHSRVHRHFTSSRSAIKRADSKPSDIAYIQTTQVRGLRNQRLVEDRVIRRRVDQIRNGGSGSLLNRRMEIRR